VSLEGLNGKTAIVTGAAGAGIGQATARAFAREGVNVVVSDAHPKRPFTVADEIKSSFGVETLGVQCDVSNEANVIEMVDKVLQHFGRIDILFNNAGTNRVSRVWEMPSHDWHFIINVNLTGIFYCTKAVLPAMMKQKKGVIINMSSIAARLCSPDDGCAYCVAKAGIEAFTKELAQELGQYNIRVNAVAPSLIWNPFTIRWPGYRQEYFDEIRQQIPLGKFGEPRDVAELVVFLASDQARYISGAVLDVTGGL
jgi:3-oxoacyl-[acyl-carrier protein] reductase